VRSAALIGIPFGACIALTRFFAAARAHRVAQRLMGLPPSWWGSRCISCYRAPDRSGSSRPLFTPSAMVVAQTILVTPIIAALARQTVEDLWTEYRDELNR